MKEIDLVNTKLKAIVDDEDYSLVNRHVWYCYKDKQTYYAIADIGDTTIRMHTLILPSPPSSLTVDHIDGNGLNNQKINLRFATSSQQAQNKRKQQSLAGYSSEYKGVCWRKDTKVWAASIRINGKLKHLGFFEKEIAAARAYNRAAKEYFGEFAKINLFPEREEGGAEERGHIN